ncbi:MAG: MoaD/ThiS family protein [Desulfobacterales bacterium]
MKVTVKLFSSLRDLCPDYDPEHGRVVDLPDPACVEDLIRILGIPESKAPVVTCNGRIMKRTDPLAGGSLLHIFQPVAGG